LAVDSDASCRRRAPAARSAPAPTLALEVGRQEVCGGAGILRRTGRCLRGEAGGEPLVEALDRHVDRLAQRLDEPFGLTRLGAVLAPKRQRESDDDAVRLLGPDELDEAGEPVLARRPLDDTHGTSERPGRV